MDRPTRDQCQPELTTSRRAWRVVGMLAVIGVAWGPMVPGQLRHGSLLALDVTCGVAAFALVTRRRRWPVPVAVATAALSAVSGIAAGPAVLAAVSVATRRQLWSILVVGLANVLAGVTVVRVQPADATQPMWLNLTVTAIFTSAVLGWGMYLGSRRELIWTLRSRAERAEAEQALRVSRARSNERARIAREMHDVLAHRISQISLHAGALAFREDLGAEEMRASAAVIREKAHEALTDLRGVLGVLRDAETGELLDAPQPTYADIADLVAEARRTGLDVDYADGLEDHGQHMPEVVGRTVYRIVQEGMTNVRKHAPGAHLTIRLSGSPEDGIGVLVRNPLGFGSATPGAGLGLVGLTERAELRGGRLEHRREGSSFVLQGWIPWTS